MRLKRPFSVKSFMMGQNCFALTFSARFLQIAISFNDYRQAGYNAVSERRPELYK